MINVRGKTGEARRKTQGEKRKKWDDYLIIKIIINLPRPVKSGGA